jgi:hypothetical protein
MHEHDGYELFQLFQLLGECSGATINFDKGDWVVKYNEFSYHGFDLNYDRQFRYIWFALSSYLEKERLEQFDK